MEATIDLSLVKEINRVKVGCLKSQDTWIFLPEEVEILASDDSANFKQVGIKTIETKESNEKKREEIVIELNTIKTRYLKVKVKNIGTCPEWHKGAGGKAWLFVDEIEIN